MCYSATASFVAFGALTTIGTASLMTSKKGDRLVASIPLLFGIQQGIEGIQWLSLNSGTTNCFAGYSYSFFASLLWPVLIPIAVMTLEPHRKRLYSWLIALGSAVSLFTAIFLIRNPLNISLVGHSIFYDFSLPYGEILIVGYLTATLGSLFLSDQKAIRWFGLFCAITAIIATIVARVTFASVWCFYCAILSACIFLYIRHRSRTASELAKQSKH